MCEDVFGCQEPLFDSCRHTTFKEHRFFHTSNLVKQHVVLHVTRTNLENIGVFTDHGNISGGHDLGNNCHAQL